MRRGEATFPARTFAGVVNAAKSGLRTSLEDLCKLGRAVKVSGPDWAKSRVAHASPLKFARGPENLSKHALQGKQSLHVHVLSGLEEARHVPA